MKGTCYTAQINIVFFSVQDSWFCFIAACMHAWYDD